HKFKEDKYFVFYLDKEKSILSRFNLLALLEQAIKQTDITQARLCLAPYIQCVEWFIARKQTVLMRSVIHNQAAVLQSDKTEHLSLRQQALNRWQRELLKDRLSSHIDHLQ